MSRLKILMIMAITGLIYWAVRKDFSPEGFPQFVASIFFSANALFMHWFFEESTEKKDKS